MTGHCRKSAWLLVAAAFAVVGMTALVGQAGVTRLRVRLSATVGPPTTRLTVKVSELEAGEPVGVLFDKRLLGKGGADPDGHFVLKTRVPRWARPGPHEVVAQAGP